MSWNYRVIRTDYIDPDSRAVEPSYSIHRCYYDKAADLLPTKWGQQPASPEGDSIQELMDDIGRFHVAVGKPVLIEKRGKLVEAK